MSVAVPGERAAQNAMRVVLPLVALVLAGSLLLPWTVQRLGDHVVRPSELPPGVLDAHEWVVVEAPRPGTELPIVPGALGVAAAALVAIAAIAWIHPSRRNPIAAATLVVDAGVTVVLVLTLVRNGAPGPGWIVAAAATAVSVLMPFATKTLPPTSPPGVSPPRPDSFAPLG